MIVLVFVSFMGAASLPDSTLVKLASADVELKHEGQAEMLRFYASQGYDSLFEVRYNEIIREVDGDRELDLELIRVRWLRANDHTDEALKVLFGMYEEAEAISSEFSAEVESELCACYYNISRYKDACEYCEKAKEKSEPGTKQHADRCSNLASCYIKIDKTKEAVEYLNEAIKAYSKLGLRSDLAEAWVNLANAYGRMANQENEEELVKLSISYYEKAIVAFTELGDTTNMAIALANLGKKYERIGKLQEANANFKQAHEILKKSGDIHAEAILVGWMAVNYAQLGEFKEAYENSLYLLDLNDSIMKLESVESIEEMRTKYETDKKDQENDILKEKNKVSALQLRSEKQKTRQRNILLGAASLGILLMAVIAIVLYRSRQIQRRANELISEQKEQLAEKNRNITDSITYAKTLQEAILPTDNVLKNHLDNHFVYFQPRDIVSGDFYWYAETKDYAFFAVADCTGHGVPGAFVSISCANILNNIIVERETTDPGQILTYAHRGILDIYKKEGKLGQANDGMDVSLLRKDLKTGEIKCAGAMNGVFIVKPSIIDEVKVDRRGLGGIAPRDYLYSTFDVHCKKGDLLVMTSDGYIDQFGGPNGKKFKRSRFKELLQEVSVKSSEEIVADLRDTINAWMGDHEQIDDILVAGFRA